MEFIFAFWNCAISPPGIKEMRAPANMADPVEVIVDLFTSKKIMFLALCEVNKDSFNHISSELGKLGLSLSAQFLPDRTLTGAEFDVGYIYESGEISVIQGMAHSARLGTSIVKVAQQLIIVINGDASSVINIFVSHWPSQLRKIADDFRDECSKGLRRYIERFIEGGQLVILMGDYNDEPYSQSLFKNIRATNDRALVLSEPNFWLYNPYWKALAARMPFTIDEQQHDFGTCYSKSGNRNHWSTFDQIIFSGHFLHCGPWYLKESSTGVVLTDKLRVAIMDSKHYFDHMPVIGCICKREVKNVSV
ncbi:hypothetical protein FMJ29_29265 [Klebsiella michiganensis]|uniref:endonuclease/exonuclease/phosphatase family protein n=1 Tax=Klebsiella michiganensis TaxID=1134687 RepID=UPI001CCA4563|nr:hypothetical protein [Klebsiella michiganensis]MBZ7463012.1 hypothetical protein [Klebsiella michiganensis]